MILYTWANECVGFIELRSVDPTDTGYEACRIIRYNPASVRDRWNHPRVEFNKWDWLGKRASRKRHPEWYLSDAPGNNYLSRRAVDALHDLLEQFGEILPLTSKDGEFYIYHCMTILDAIDRLKCEFHWSTIVSYVFKPDVIQGQHLFLQAAPNEGPIFVSDTFVDRVNAAGLKGFKFTPVWSDQAGPIVEPPPTPRVEGPRFGRTYKPMSRSTRRDVVEKLVAMARKDLNIDVAADPPDLVFNRIIEEAKSAQAWAHSVQESVGVGMTLGSLWGELVCRDCGWTWAMVDKIAAIVSPGHSHVIFPHQLFHNLIIGKTTGLTSEQLFKMIKSNELPAAEPKSYAILD